jgi:PD-(D/E)XK nuclease superfamily
MSRILYTDRSRIETYQRCARLRFLSYHEAGLGLAPAKESLPLAVGKAVHKGLETLLLHTRALENGADPMQLEDAAVAAALADFAPHRRGIALDLAEETAMAVGAGTDLKNFDAQLIATATELGMDPSDPALRELVARQKNSAAEFDDWLYQEQAALVEGMVRAYARRRLRPLLEEFEVLEVEREGDWELASASHDWVPDDADDPEYSAEHCGFCGRQRYKEVIHSTECYSLRFMSRPDALLRSRADNSLYLLSYKTAATWDVRKARDAEHDMQGLSEGVEVERRLGDWWAKVRQGGSGMSYVSHTHGSKAMFDYLTAIPAPPRILGIRYEYLLKSSRYADKDLSSRFGLNVWAQRSHLIRAYQGLDGTWCWSYEFQKDDGGSSKLYYKNWRPKAVWEVMPIKQWIDMLDASTETMSAYDSTTGMEPRLLGYKSEAQSQGYTEQHPLDLVFPAPMVIFRQSDDLRDWIESTEAQEVRVAEAVAQIEAAADEGEKRHLLNILMPMSRRSCSYPTECVFASTICYANADAKADPLSTGKFKRRIPNHTAEQEASCVSDPQKNGVG